MSLMDTWLYCRGLRGHHLWYTMLSLIHSSSTLSRHTFFCCMEAGWLKSPVWGFALPFSRPRFNLGAVTGVLVSMSSGSSGTLCEALGSAGVLILGVEAGTTAGSLCMDGLEVPGRAGGTLPSSCWPISASKLYIMVSSEDEAYGCMSLPSSKAGELERTTSYVLPAISDEYSCEMFKIKMQMAPWWIIR